MVPLATRDLGRLLAYGRAFEARAPVPNSGAVGLLLDAVADLVPGETAVITVSTVPGHVTFATDDLLANRRNTANELWTQCIADHQHSVISHHTNSGARAAAMTSDFMNPFELRRTTLFDYFWRPFAIDRTMGARIDLNKATIYLASYRTGLDFSERDRVMLDGLTGHARRFLQRGDVADLASDCRSRFDLTARESEILIWAIRGWTVPAMASLLVLSPATVKAHLRNIYRKTGWGSRAIAMAAVYRAPGTGGARTGDGGQDGLTGRETDVLLALARGWSNQQIAKALNMSLETTKTHLRHAYQKLGVSNRTEATARVLEPRPAA